MRDKFVFWLPGSSKTLQYQRLQRIFAPVLQQLEQRGLAGLCAAMRSDRFDRGAGAVNIWLASEFLDAPPFAGCHVLWFLPQMKIAPHSVLLAYDALLTASQTHARFLTRWLGDLRPVEVLSWPVDWPEDGPEDLPVDAPLGGVGRPNGAGANGLNLAYSTPVAQAGAVYNGTLPAEAAPLAALLAQSGGLHSLLPLRERQCGFYSYEEAVAVLAGCPLHSAPRQGLPGPLAALLAPADQTAPAQRLSPADWQDWRALHDPAQIAARLAALRHLPPWPKAPRPPNAPPVQPRPKIDAQHSADSAAFFRDWQPVIAQLNQIAAPPALLAGAKADLAAPWAGGVQGALPQPQDALPWSDLSLVRARLQQLAEQGQLPSAADMPWLHQLRRVLRRYDPSRASPALALAEDLPSVPWARIARESIAPRRDYLALSRAVNGHNLYRFGHQAAPAPARAPLIPPGQIDPRPLLAQSAIFLHGYYLEIALEIVQMLHAQMADCPIYIATDTAEKQSALQGALHRLAWTRHRVDLVVNRGRDIHSKLVHFAPDHADHAFVLHVHTKKSPHSSSLAQWGGQMVAALAGGGGKLGQIAQAFAQDAALGMIYADPPRAVLPALRWTRNLRLAERLAAQMRLPALPRGEDLDFPAGSMFWARRAALAPWAQAALTAAHFAPEGGQEDGTLAHACERLLGVIAQAQGYHLARSCAEPASAQAILRE